MAQGRKTRLRRFLRMLLAVTIAFIWLNSLLPKEESSELSGWIFRWILKLGVPIPTEYFLRKLAHFSEFFLLSTELALLFWLRSGLGFQNLCNSAFAALLTAMTDETIQMFTGRGSQLKDVLLDFSGALTGIAVTALAIGIIGKRKVKADS